MKPSRDEAPATAPAACNLMSVSIAAEALGRSKSTLYRMIRRNLIPHAREGRRVFVDGTALRAMLPTRPTEASASAEKPSEAVVPSTGQGQRELTPGPWRPYVVIFFA